MCAQRRSVVGIRTAVIDSKAVLDAALVVDDGESGRAVLWSVSGQVPMHALAAMVHATHEQDPLYAIAYQPTSLYGEMEAWHRDGLPVVEVPMRLVKGSAAEIADYVLRTEDLLSGNCLAKEPSVSWGELHRRRLASSSNSHSAISHSFHVISQAVSNHSESFLDMSACRWLSKSCRACASRFISARPRSVFGVYSKKVLRWVDGLLRASYRGSEGAGSGGGASRHPNPTGGDR